MLTTSQAAKFLGLHVDTLRKLERRGRVKCILTEGGHRRFEEQELIRYKNGSDKIADGDKLVIGYCRVSSTDQKGDLERQIGCVSGYCAAKGYQFKIIKDLGSGLNFKKKGLKELISLIESGTISKIVVNYKDRLVRFGYEMIEEICMLNNVEIEVINHTEDKTYEEELVEDVLSVITVFSAKLYGSRSRKSKALKDKIVEALKE